MNINEFEAQVRDVIDSLLNELQTLALSSTELEPNVLAVGMSVRTLAEIIEDYIAEQRQA
ncbi:hypothetical protein [Pantanalinema sp. GBBB05]|uniref:hypothetical protein n=1 Tax=Pantanalinema sp. GBBB05 TaxID=2604139 RepID=UPI001D2E7528|nr:hypothetical protein [Pantanalinema sp. GBBB05]